MKIIVPVKRVVDYRAVIRLKPDQSEVETTNVKMSMNPFDEIALEEALRIKEKKIADEIIIVSVGKESCQETLRSGLAMGADRAILVKTDEIIEPLSIAKILKIMIEKEGATLAILGKQAIDSDDNQTGQMLAGILQWPQGTFASKIEFVNQGVSVTREIDGGLETLFLKLPAVITTDLRLNEPRYISLPNIVKAKSKPLKIIELSDLNISTPNSLRQIKVMIPKRERAGTRVESATDLIHRLKNEAQVI